MKIPRTLWWPFLKKVKFPHKTSVYRHRNAPRHTLLRNTHRSIVIVSILTKQSRHALLGPNHKKVNSPMLSANNRSFAASGRQDRQSCHQSWLGFIEVNLKNEMSIHMCKGLLSLTTYGIVMTDIESYIPAWWRDTVRQLYLKGICACFAARITNKKPHAYTTITWHQ